MSRREQWWIIVAACAGTALVMSCVLAFSHPNCPPGCIEASGPTPAPTAAPSPSPVPTTAARCPAGTPKLNLGTSITRVIPAGARLIYCTQVSLPSPPSRLRWEMYENSDQDCGNLRMTVRQLVGAMQVKSTGPGANGSVSFTKRVGQGEDPARVANGDYLVELEGFATHCTSYEIRAGAL